MCNYLRHFCTIWGRQLHGTSGAVRYTMMYPAPEVVERLLESAPALIPGAASDRFVASQFRTLFARSRIGNRHLSEEALLEVLSSVFARFGAVRRWGRAAPRGLGTVVARFLRDHLTGRPRVASLATELGYHPEHLARVFREDFGVSPHTFLIGLRVEHARTLLSAGAEIATAAVASGFVDQSHLTRHFRRILGVPPWRYQRRLGVGFVQESRSAVE